MQWVLDQVNEQIRLGKTESKEIAPDEDYRQTNLPAFDAKSLKRGRTRKKEEFLVTTEYTEKEKLFLLVDAIDQVVVNTNTMVRETLDFMQREFKIDEITFYAVEDQRTKTFSGVDFAKGAESILVLKELLKILRNQIYAD